MRVLTVIGARPQFIKAAIVSRAMQAASDMDELLLHTGQHYDENMSGVFFTELGIPTPHFQLESGPGTHGAQTARMLAGIESAIQESKPDWVLVYGDTNSTLAGALAAVKLHVPVAHVEAGVRSFNRYMPEEINRIATDHICQLLLPPTKIAIDLLVKEGVPSDRIHLVGDVTCDAAVHFAGFAESQSDILDRLDLDSKSYALVTAHRAENVRQSEQFAQLISGIKDLAKSMQVVWPVHPGTRKLANEQGLFDDLPAGLKLIDPIGFLDSLCLQKHAIVLATDSGGMQKEAFVLGIPCLTLREETEWTETIDLGWNRLVRQTEFADLRNVCERWLEQERDTEKLEFFGDGESPRRIVEVLRQYANVPKDELFILRPNGPRKSATHD
ncbi:MAG: UDP-GlcNAc3NAcA epimerase [Pirellulaceae bacterium]|jgi:UDP-GlcNAc3NAcA epimerase